MPSITAIYFSATGNTEKSVNALADGVATALGSNAAEALDVTNQPSPEPREFGAEDFVVFGIPV